MNEYRNIITGLVVTEHELKRLHPESLLVLDAATLDWLGYDPVLPSPQPEATRFQAVVRNGVTQDSLGNWIQAWAVVDCDEAQVATRIDLQWSTIRSTRDSILTSTDWVVIKALETGVPAPTEWLTYRQSLRDITTQVDPFDITWPVAPINH